MRLHLSTRLMLFSLLTCNLVFVQRLCLPLFYLYGADTLSPHLSQNDLLGLFPLSVYFLFQRTASWSVRDGVSYKYPYLISCIL